MYAERKDASAIRKPGPRFVLKKGRAAKDWAKNDATQKSEDVLFRGCSADAAIEEASPMGVPYGGGDSKLTGKRARTDSSPSTL